MWSRLRTLALAIPMPRVPESGAANPVGRWSTDSAAAANIRAALASHDCCGDRVCGDPLEAKHAIARELANTPTATSTATR